jgi:hypothetical protein
MLKRKLVEFISINNEFSEKNGLRLKEPMITDIQPLSKYNSVIQSKFIRELRTIEKLMKFKEKITDEEGEDCEYVKGKGLIARDL